MPVTTTSAAVHITPVVLKTFYKHTKRKGQKLKDGDTSEQATDDILFDEAFHIVKSFIELGTRNTVESLQHFTNTHVPAPYWAAVSPALIPLSSCNKAADLLISWFDPEELKCVVGGERWWQVRGLDGIDAEWITEREYLDDAKPPVDRKLSATDQDIFRMEHLDTVMLYVHGGGYYWGSINTHRYQIIRYTRKFQGRAFMVNYRKAPQYPWPCPLQDVLAAYFYLTSPPPDALHKPIPPSKIVFAGDSAGGGLCISALTVLRDMGLEQPAGAVLISPWVDLTHSFPSVMKNTATDIIPPHGFIHKTSPTWPIECVPKEGRARVVPTQTNPPPKPGHADTLRPSREQAEEQFNERLDAGQEDGRLAHTQELKDKHVKDQAAMLDEHHDAEQGSKTPGNESLDFWEPKPPKVLMKDPKEKPLELRSQIQFYATNEQLTHPLVSPVLQASLGNLCPLYIIAGDGEVLRDEIMYLAHKAANPQKYPPRKGVLQDSPRQRENVEKFQTPTKVHLQVFDDMCHVLTVFIFTEGARYAYRSIAEFVKHVTRHSADHLERNPFPELHRPPSQISDSAGPDETHSHHSHKDHTSTRDIGSSKSKIRRPRPDSENSARSDIELYRQNEETAKDEVKNDDVQLMPGSQHSQGPDNEQDIRDIPLVSMIRERVDIFGKVRVMEDEDEIACLHIPVGELGLIKEDPVRRWLAGQEQWDKKYRRNALKAERKRAHYKKKAADLIEKARSNGLKFDQDTSENGTPKNPPLSATLSRTSVGEVVSDRRWGPFDLDGEKPPDSAIAGRRDTREAVALIKKNIFHSAPVTHNTVPSIPTSTAIRAAFNTEDHPFRPPKQSSSEEQSYPIAFPIHGLKIWQSLISYFMKKSSKKARAGKRQAIKTLHTASDKLTGSPSPSR